MAKPPWASGCQLCEGMACCPEHCCDWDGCQCGDCEQCGGVALNDTIASTTAQECDDDEEPVAPVRSFLSTRRFWDDHFKDLKLVEEWIASPEHLRDLVEAVTPDRLSSILEVGCGNSALAYHLAAAGYARVLAVDFSRTALEWQTKNGRAKAVALAQMDVCSLAVRSGTLDVVVDKGTLDAILCDSTHGHENVERMCREISRALRAGGVYLHVSDADDEVRKRLLDQPQLYGWTMDKQVLPHAVRSFALGETFNSEPAASSSADAHRRPDYVYICRKAKHGR